MKAPTSQADRAHDHDSTDGLNDEQERGDSEEYQSFRNESQPSLDHSGQTADVPDVVEQLSRVTLKMEGIRLPQVPFEQALREIRLHP